MKEGVLNDVVSFKTISEMGFYGKQGKNGR